MDLEKWNIVVVEENENESRNENVRSDWLNQLNFQVHSLEILIEFENECNELKFVELLVLVGLESLGKEKLDAS